MALAVIRFSSRFPLLPLAASLLLTSAVSAQDAVQTTRRVDRALFLVRTEHGWGSGFLFGDRHSLVTNRHVIEPLTIGDEVQVRPVVEDSEGFITLGVPVAAVIRYLHPWRDLAVLEVGTVPPGALPLQVAPQARERLMPRGTEVWAFGFPSTGAPSVSSGVIASHYRDVTDGAFYYLTDVALAPGSSGGPITDAEGGLLGVATALYDVPEELGFAWGYLLPARDVMSCFPNGMGIDGLPAHFDLSSWLGRIRGAGSGQEAFRVAGRAFEELDALAWSHEEFFRGGTKLLQAVEEVARLESSGDALAWMEFRNRLLALVLTRSALLGWDGIELPPGVVEGLPEASDRLAGALADDFVRSLASSGLDSGRTTMELLLDQVADDVRKGTDELGPAAERLHEFLSMSPEELPSARRDRVVQDVAIVFGAATSYLLALGLDEDDLDTAGLPRASRRRFSAEIVRARNAWAAIPPDVAAIVASALPELGLEVQDASGALEGTAGAWRDRLAAIGLDPSVTETFSMVGLEGRRFIVEMAREDFPFVAFAHPADERAQVDLDLQLFAPDGTLVDSDTLPDPFPVVEADSGAAGKWELLVLNRSPRPVEVRLEIWER